MGSGPIRAGVPIVVDIWPRDNESFVYCDMTRTFVVGEVPDDVREWHRLCKEALDRAVSEIRHGADGRAIFDGTCEIFEAAGEPTQRTKEPGKPLVDGFFHGLGHGVGLEVHEEPGLGRIGGSPLRAGDVVTVEPGLYRQGYGGVRLEDLVLVTEDGAENLTHVPVRPRAVSGIRDIDTLFLEERRYPPSPEFARRRTRSPGSTRRSSTRSGSAKGRERVGWFEPFTKLYEWEPAVRASGTSAAG